MFGNPALYKETEKWTSPSTWRELGYNPHQSSLINNIFGRTVRNNNYDDGWHTVLVVWDKTVSFLILPEMRQARGDKAADQPPIRSVPSSLRLNVSDSAFLMIGTKRLSHMQHWRGKTKKFCCHDDCLELRDQSMTKATEKGFVLNRYYCNIVLWKSPNESCDFLPEGLQNGPL